MVMIIFIYMHICKCKHYTHENDVAKLYKKVLYLMVEEFHHQFQLFELQYNATVLTSCTKCSWEEKLTRLVFWSIYIFSATAKEEIYMNSPWWRGSWERKCPKKLRYKSLLANQFELKEVLCHSAHFKHNEVIFL